MPQQHPNVWVEANGEVTEVFIYGMISRYEEDARGVRDRIQEAIQKSSRIRVRINSGGGSVFEGLAIYNIIQQADAEVETQIDGLAASMASLIALAGKKVRMAENALYMVHGPMTVAIGNAEKLREQAELLDKLKGNMADIYAAKSGKDREEVMQWMTGKDRWFNSQEAEESGLIDEVIGKITPAAPKKEEDADAILKAYGQYLPEPFTQTSYQQSNKEDMEISKLAGRLGLSAQNEQEFVEQVAQFQKQNQELKEQLKKNKIEAAKAAVCKAAEAGKLDDKTKEHWLAKAEEQPEITQDFAENLPQPAVGKPAEASLQPWHQKPSGASSSHEATAEEWDKLDKADKLTALKKNEPERFAALYEAKFGVQPQES